MANGGGKSAGGVGNPKIEVKSTDYFLKTLFGRLVIFELILTLICGACSSGTGSHCRGPYGFLAFFGWIYFLYLLIFTILKLLDFWDRFRRFWIFHHPIILVIFYVLATVGFLIGSCLAAWCAHHDHATGAGTVAAVFGFCCSFVFGIELFLAARAYWSSE